MELDSDLLFPGQQVTTVVTCEDCRHYAITCKIPQSELAFVLTTIPCRYSGLAGPCLTEGHKEQGGTMARHPLPLGQRGLFIIPLLAVFVITAFITLSRLHNMNLTSSNKFKMIRACLS